MTFQDQDQPSSRVCVGKIASAHGVKGLVKILPFVEDFGLLKNVYISESSNQILELTIKNPLGKFILAAIKGITDRNGAEALGKCSLFVPRETNLDLPENITVIGKRAVSADGARIGVVRGVENYGASDLLDILLDSGKSVMIPLAPAFVDINSETVTISNYEVFLG